MEIFNMVHKIYLFVVTPVAIIIAVVLLVLRGRSGNLKKKKEKIWSWWHDVGYKYKE